MRNVIYKPMLPPQLRYDSVQIQRAEKGGGGGSSADAAAAAASFSSSARSRDASARGRVASFAFELLDCRGFASSAEANASWTAACPPPHVPLRSGLPMPRHAPALAAVGSADDRSQECACNPMIYTEYTSRSIILHGVICYVFGRRLVAGVRLQPGRQLRQLRRPLLAGGPAPNISYIIRMY